VWVIVTGGPGSLKDWVGMFAAKGTDLQQLDWKYMNNSKTAPTTGITRAVLLFRVPATPGTYNFRFFKNQTYQKLATSPTITVK
jgi:hypothetical protein